MNIPLNLFFNLATGLYFLLVFLLSARAKGDRHSALSGTALMLCWSASALWIWANPPTNTQLTLAASILSPTLGLLALQQWAGRFRTILNGISLPQLFLVHAARIPLGAMIYFAGPNGALPLQFANEAGIGDIVSGLLALFFVASAALRQRRAFVLAWSVFGLLDLINALRLGLTVVVPFAIATGQNNIGLIPTFGVPLLLISHFLIAQNVIQKHITLKMAHGPA